MYGEGQGVVAGPVIVHEAQDRPYLEIYRKVKALPLPQGDSAGGEQCACANVPSIPQAEPGGQCARKDTNRWWGPEATGVDPGTITDPCRTLGFPWCELGCLSEEGCG